MCTLHNNAPAPVYNAVNDAVAQAADMATQAFSNGTFSVGGIMLDNAGTVLKAFSNAVVVGGITADPTAHGERQLIDWYWAQRAAGVVLPDPSDITIVTSLDPCCMCSGAILEGGFKVVTAAFDNYSGINWDLHADFPTLSEPLKAQAQASFSYPEVDGDTAAFARSASGAALPGIFSAGSTLTQANTALCLSLFDATLDSVKAGINTDLTSDQLLNPADLPANDPIIVALTAAFPEALAYHTAIRGTPNEGLAAYLLAAMATDIQNGGSGNAVAMLDWHGNMLACQAGNETASPIQTAFLLLTRAYAQLRRNLILANPADETRIRQYLGHPKYATFVFARSPDQTARSLLELGAYGSTMEGSVPPENPVPFQFVLPSATLAPDQLTGYVQGMPPLYSASVVVNPRQVASAALVSALAFAPSKK